MKKLPRFLSRLALLLLLVQACQKPEFPYLEVSHEEISAEYPGSQFPVTIETNGNWTISLSQVPQSKIEWIHFNRTEGKGKDNVIITVDAAIGESRTATVVVSGPDNLSCTIKVNQKGKLDFDLSTKVTPEFLQLLDDLDLRRRDGTIPVRSLRNVTRLDVSGRHFSDWSEFSFFEELKWFTCQNCDLTALNTGTLPNLIELDCSNNSLETLDLSLFPALIFINANNNQLKDLKNLSVCKKLTRLYCKNNLWTSLAPDSKSLEVLLCQEGQLTSLDLSHAPALNTLDCSENKLKSLDLSPMAAAEYVTCDDNPLETLIVPSQNNLVSLSCSNCKLSGTLSPASSILSLRCYNNNLDKLDLTSAPNLGYLKCQNNRLTELCLPGDATKLVEIDCSHNQISSFSIPAGCSKLYSLDCSDNLLYTVDVSKAAYPIYLYIHNNPGKDGVFELYVRKYWCSYTTISDWTWNEQNVHVETIEI